MQNSLVSSNNDGRAYISFKLKEKNNSHVQLKTTTDEIKQQNESI